MKRFLLKFLALFAIIYCCLGIYGLYIKPNISGEVGIIGQIPFGHDYIDSLHIASQSVAPPIIVFRQGDSITASVLTIGDSFSQQGEFGYSHYVAKQLNCSLLNIHKHLHIPEQSFIQLVHGHQIPDGTIVILQSVERLFIQRLATLDFSDNEPFTIPCVSSHAPKEDLLSSTIVWLLKCIGIKQPIHVYQTRDELFSHKTRHHKIYIYDSPWDNDGDFRFTTLHQADYDMAWINLYKLKELADVHYIHLIYLVAADKYDVYEPFIVNAPIHNPTLDSLPKEKWIVNSKPILQDAVSAGVPDVYYINDSHWSPVGAKIVGTAVAARIKELYLCE